MLTVIAFVVAPRDTESVPAPPVNCTAVPIVSVHTRPPVAVSLEIVVISKKN